MLIANILVDLLLMTLSGKCPTFNLTLSCKKMRNSRSQHSARSVNEGVIDSTNDFVQDHQGTLWCQDLSQTEIHALLANSCRHRLWLGNSSEFYLEKSFLPCSIGSCNSSSSTSDRSKCIIHDDVLTKSRNGLTSLLRCHRCSVFGRCPM